MIKRYSPTQCNFWTGRIDDNKNRDAFRMHQVIENIDLNKLETFSINSTKFNICLLGFKSDIGIKRNLGRTGAQKGPIYIRKELANMPVRFNENIKIYDGGDIYCLNDELEDAQNQLQSAISLILQNGMFPIVLGGGHEVAYGHFNGISDYLEKKYEKDKTPAIINFDAHFDIRPYKKEGSSGTMFAQIADNCKKINLDFSYLCLGIQTYANTNLLFKRAESYGVKYVLAKDFIESNYLKIYDTINQVTRKKEHVYLTICCDVFNSAFAPGVSAIQPFGMNPETVLLFIKEIFKTEKVISIDFAEVAPRFDDDNRTAKLVAVMIYSVINSLTEIHNAVLK